MSLLCENIPLFENAAKGAHMFMLLFIETFLCSDLGSTMNLCYLGGLRKIEQIQNYGWGGMAYATLMHFMTQLSRWTISSLGGAPFVWQVRFEIFWLRVGFGKLFWLCMGFGKLFWLCGNGVVNFSSLNVRVLWNWS